MKAFLSNPPPDLMNIVMSSNCQALTVINNSPGVWAGNVAADGDAIEV